MATKILFRKPPNTAQPLGLVFSPEPRGLTDLLFQEAPNTSNPDLLFRPADEAPPTPLTNATLDIVASMSALSGAVTMAQGVPIIGAGALPAFGGAFNLEYFSQTERPLVSSVQSIAQVAVKVAQGITQPESHGTQYGASTLVSSQPAIECPVPAVGMRYEEGVPVSQGTTQYPLEAVGVGTELGGLSQEAVKVTVQATNPFQEGMGAGSSTLSFLFQEGMNTPRVYLHSRWSEAIARRLQYQGHTNAAIAKSRYWASMFQEGRRPPAGIHTRPPVPVAPPFHADTALLFQCPPLPYPFLVFGLYPCEQAFSRVIPVRRIYMVINTATLRRVDGDIPIPVFDMSLSLDMESWTWAFTAKVPSTSLSDLEPASSGAPIEVEATINGVDYRILVEGLSRSKEFGKSTLNLTGRGKSAVLDSPYAPSQLLHNSIDRTAQQLMGDVLTVNGVSMGWDVVWGLTDWLVPAGVFSHQGTPMSMVKKIVESVGGYIQPHPTATSLIVKHKYPVTPWTWASVTPDFVLPSSVTIKEDVSWEERARYNRVYVAGGRSGVLARVTIDGTDGAVLAPMVSDDLITHADAARQRGMAVLGATGRAAKLSLSLPVMSETGIILPGSFVKYTDGGVAMVGLSRSVQVSVGRPQIRQVIGVETYVS